MTYKLLKETTSKYLYEIYIALRNILTYKINLPQRLHSDVEPIYESTYFNFKMSASIKQKEEGDLFCLFQYG